MTRTVIVRPLRRSLALSTALGVSLGVFTAPAAAQTAVDLTAPAQGAKVDSGLVTVPGQTVKVTVNQARSVVNWTTFNVPQGTTANFVNASNAPTAVVLNRVTTIATTNTTTLGGTINGVNSLIDPALPRQGYGVEVWISNPNGILMGSSGSFNTQGFVATTLAFDNTAVSNFLAGGSNKPVRLTSAGTATDPGITGSVGTIRTNGHIQAFIAPVIRLSGGTFDATVANGTAGDIGFVVASDVTISNADSPLGIVVNAGTRVAGPTSRALDLGGTVTAGNAYMVVSAQAAVNALLNVSANVTTASNVNGIVVLGGDNGGTSIGQITVANTVANSGGVAVTTGGALTANNAGGIRVLGGDAVTVNGALTTGFNGDVRVSNYQNDAAVSVTGNVTSGGDYFALGGTVTLGKATATLQRAIRNVTATSATGALTGVGPLTLAADTAIGGATMTLGAVTGFAFDPSSTLVSGSLIGTARSTINFVGAASQSIVLGDVHARALLQNGTPGLNRTGAITTGDLMLSGANTIATTGLLKTKAVATEGDLLLRGDAGVTVGGTLTNLGTGAGKVTVIGAGPAAGVVLQDTVTLTGDLTVTADTAGAIFTTLTGTGSKTVNSAGGIYGNIITGPGAVALTAASGRALIINGTLGTAEVKLASLTLNGGGETLGPVYVAGVTSIGQTAAPDFLNVVGPLDTGSLVADAVGAITFGAVRSRTGGIDVASSGGPVTFKGVVNGPGALIVGAGGAGSAVTFQGAVGDATPFASFTSTGGTRVRLDGGSLTTTGTQTYGGALVLGSNTVLTGSGATFNGIDGAGGGVDHDLSLNFTGAQVLHGVTGVRNLRTDSVGPASGGTTLSGLIRTSGLQIYNDAVTLAGDATLESTGAAGDANSHAITFGSTLNGAAALTVITPGLLTFTGVVGATPLSAIDATKAAQVSIKAAAITTTGAQSYGATMLDGTNNVTLSAGGDVRFAVLNGPRGLTVNSSGTTTLTGGATPLSFITTDAGGSTVLGGTVRTVNTQTYNDAVSLIGDTVLTGGLVVFPNTVTGNGFDLTINTSGAQRLGDNIVGVNNLTTDAQVNGTAGTTTLTGSITTTGNQSYGDTGLIVANDVTLTAGTGKIIDIAGSVNGDTETRNLTLTASEARLRGDVGTGTNGRLASLTVNGQTNILGLAPQTIRTVGGQSFNGALLLNSDLTLIGTGAAFGGSVGSPAVPHGLTLTFSAANTLAANPFANIASLLVNGAGVTTLNGDVTAIGAQTYVSDLALGGPVTLTSSNGGAISLRGVVGEQALAVTTGGVTTFATGLSGLTSITTDAPGSTLLGGSMATTGAQNYRDAVVLGADLIVQSTGGDTLDFGGTVTGARALTVDSTGLTTFGGAVGQVGAGGVANATSPTALFSSGTGAVRVNGGAITTAGAQSYLGQLSLGANTVLTGTDGILAGGVAGNGFDLTLNFSGPTAIGGGSFDGVNNFASGGGGTTSLSGIINTTGGQSYADKVVLTGTTVLRSGDGTGTGAISFGRAVDGAEALTITTGGTTTFNGAVGTTPLASLTVDGAGAVAINGGAITTTGAQSYTGPATLGANTRLTTEGFGIAFGETVNGPFQLSARTGTGAITAGTVSFGGALGGTAALTGLAIRANAATLQAGNRVGTLAALVNTGGLSFTDAGALTVGTVDGLTGIATGTDATILSASGLLTLNGGIASGGASLTGTGIVQAAGATVNAGAGPITLDANDGAISLAGTLTTTDAGTDAVRLIDAVNVQLGSIQTGAGGTVTLGLAGADNLSGSLTQAAGTVLTAGVLTGSVGGAATLGNANAIATLGAFSASGVVLHVTGGLAVTGPVDAGAGNLSLLADGGPLQLGGDLTATAGTTTLNVGGAIVQTGGGIVTQTLTGTATGAVSLTSGSNAFGNLAGFTSGGAFALRDAVALGVAGNVTSGGTLEITAPGISFGGRTLSAVGAVTLDGQAGDVTGASLTGAGLSVTGAGVNIGTVNAGTGALAVTTTDPARGLTLGTASAGTTAALTAAGGLTVSNALTAGGDIATVSGGATQIGRATSTGGAVRVTGASVELATANATGALSVLGTAGALSIGKASAGSTATLASAGALTVATTLSGGGDIATTSGGATRIASVTSTGGAISATGAGVDLGNAAAGSALSVTTTDAARGLTLGTASAGTTASLTAAGALTVSNALTAGGDIATTSGGVTQIGRVTSTGGAVGVTGASVNVANAAASGALLLRGTTGALSLGTGTAGGAATLDAGGTLDLTGSLTSTGNAALTATGATTLTNVASMGGAVLITGTSASVTSAKARTTLDVQATGGNLSLATGTAGGDATLTASGGVALGTLGTVAVPVGGNITVKAANGGVTGTSVVASGAATVTATGPVQIALLNGAGVAVTGQSIDVTNTTSTAALSLNATGGTLTLGTGVAAGTADLTATGDLTVATKLTSGASTTITAGGNARLRQVLATGGNLTVTAAGSIGGPNGTRADLAATGPGGVVRLAAGNGLVLGQLQSNSDLEFEAPSIDLASVTAASLKLNATVGSLTLGTATIAGAATLTANTAIAVTKLDAGGAATVSAGGPATIGAISGSDVRIVGASATVGTATANTGLLLVRATAGDLTLGTGRATTTATLEAPGAMTVSGALTAGGDAVLMAGGAASVRSVTSTGGAVAVQGTSANVATALSKTALSVIATAGDATLGAANAGGDALVRASGAVALGTLASGGSAVVTAGGGDLTGTSVTAIGAASATAANALRLTTLDGASVSGSARSVEVTNSNSGGALALTATAGPLTLGKGIATGAATLTASGPVTIATSLTAGGNAAVVAGGAATIASIASGGDLGVTGTTVGVTSASAGGDLAFRSTDGALALGTGIAASAATLSSAGPLSITTSLTSGGNAQVSSTGAATIASIASIAGDVGVTGTAVGVTRASAAGALTLGATNGALALGTGTAGAGATLSSTGPLSITTSLTSGGSAQVNSTGTATIAGIASTTGAVGVSGTGVGVTNGKAATTLDLTATAGDLTLGTGIAGGAATLKASGAVGSTSLTSGGAATLTAGTTLTSGTLNATGAVAVTATGAARLGQTSSGAAVTVTAATINAGQTNAGAALTMTSPGNITLAGGQAGGDASFDSGGTASLGQVLAGSGSAITVKALDAAITGTQRASKVTFINRAPATTGFKLGNNTTAGGFALNATEVNNVEAGQLTFDGGAGNIEVGTLAFDADAGRARVDLLATGRIDVTGVVSGTGANRVFRLGGTAANPADKANVIRVVSTADAGGRLLVDTADLDLRGARIGVGQAGGFLDPIGFGNATGQSVAAVSGDYVSNPNSSLYNASFGGVAYPAGAALITARSLSVRFTDYALFQNTGAPGLSGGVALGTLAGGPTSGTLVVQGPGSGTANGFALFGTIGGVSGTSAAVLAPTVVNITGTDIANTRVNGCIVGSGAGCLTAVVVQPLLSIFDSGRTAVFRTGDDVAVPFDPVVATNNEALFAGMELIDDPISGTDCAADADSPVCEQSKEQAK